MTNFQFLYFFVGTNEIEEQFFHTACTLEEQAIPGQGNIVATIDVIIGQP